MHDPLWIFAYGSLIFRPGFPYCDRVSGAVVGYERRFWQASVDHRGTPEQPGRVVTLVAATGTSCGGVAYRVREEDRERVLSELEQRERGGYSLCVLPFAAPVLNAVRGPAQVVCYVALPENPQYVGPEDEQHTAAIIAHAHGPSGANVEYLHKLDQALRAISVSDEHVARLVTLLA
jgi:glutathione-specific gamma-glutamylcyclotransferase